MSYSPPTFDPPNTLPTKKRRVWPWVVIPVGCLSVLLVCCGGFAMLGIGVMAALKSSEPYKVGLARAKANPEVREALGDPVEPSFAVQGSVKLNNDDGDADISFPISGSKGVGQVHVRGTKTDGAWSYDEVSVTIVNGGKTIDLSNE
jgi:hypothetical protein